MYYIKLQNIHFMAFDCTLYSLLGDSCNDLVIGLFQLESKVTRNFAESLIWYKIRVQPGIVL